MENNRTKFYRHIAQTSPFPLGYEIHEAKGVYLYGNDDFKFIDLISGIGVSSIGHCHPNIVKAVQDQVQKYMHLMVYGEFIQTPQVQLAEAISNTLPESLNSIYFTNSGTEATEGAMKLAKRVTGRTQIIAAKKAYHGSTQGALSLQSEEEFAQPFRPLLPDVDFIQYDHFSEIDHITSETAAVFLETVQGEAGVRVSSEGYLKAVKNRCQEVGALLILDEIQTGFGRTGTFWGFEQFDVVPDVVLMAKGMGGGMPIGAFAASKELTTHLSHEPILGHITTFGGHPVNCAASLACVKVLQEEGLIEKVKAKSELFKKELIHPAIKEIRGAGLMLAAQFESFEVLKNVIDKTLENGVLTDWFLFCDDTMRIAPPLIISEEEIIAACEIIKKSIDEVL